jgi:hypothetical protein
MKFKKLTLTIIAGIASLQTFHGVAMDSKKFTPITCIDTKIDRSTQLEQALLDGDIKLMAELQNAGTPVSLEALYALLESPNRVLVRRFFQEPINLDESTFFNFITEIVDIDYNFTASNLISSKEKYFERFILRLISITGHCPTCFASFFNENNLILSTLKEIVHKTLTPDSINALFECVKNQDTLKINLEYYTYLDDVLTNTKNTTFSDKYKKQLTKKRLQKRFPATPLCMYLFTAAATGNYNVLKHLAEPNTLLMKTVRFGPKETLRQYWDLFPIGSKITSTPNNNKIPLLAHIICVDSNFNKMNFISELLQIVDVTDIAIYSAIRTTILQQLPACIAILEKLMKTDAKTEKKQTKHKISDLTAVQKHIKTTLASQRQHKQLMKQSNILLNSECTIPLFDDEYCIVPGEIGLKILEYCPVTYGKVDIEKHKKNKITNWSLNNKSIEKKDAQAFLA